MTKCHCALFPKKECCDGAGIDGPVTLTFPLGAVVNLAVLLGQWVWVRWGQKVLGGARDTVLTLVLGS